MREITILSGKGGTGKTSIAAALASIAKNAVFCDNDVDAADLHLILNPKIKEEHIFHGAYVATIDQTNCTQCGICADNCRFDAIHFSQETGYTINPFQCEGCRLCERVCPEDTISSEKSTANSWYVSDTRYGQMVHAHMGPGEENSGKLVTEVRRKARAIAEDTGADFVINDGPPGIGCAAISSVTGTGQVLIVAEPTKSGLHDAKRLVELVESFKIPTFALINKYDINPEVSEEVAQYFKEKKIPVLAKINFDTSFVKAMIEGKTIVEYDEGSDISKALKKMWGQLTKDV